MKIVFLLLSFLVLIISQYSIHAIQSTVFWTNAQKRFFGYELPVKNKSQSIQDEKNETHPWVDLILYGSIEEAQKIREQRQQHIKAERAKLREEIKLQKLKIQQREKAQVYAEKLYYEVNKERLEKQAKNLRAIEEFHKQRAKKS